MKISTKGRYGLEALIDLALHSEGSAVSLREVADRCSLSQSYILQIFLVLRRAEFVESIRGAQGGYILARGPSEIALVDVLESLEGPLVPVSCLRESGEGEICCARESKCPTRGFWDGMADHIMKDIAGLTLEDALECCRSLPPALGGEMEFFI